MVRTRPLVIVLAAALVLSAGFAARGAETPTSSAESVPIDRQPYRTLAHVAAEPGARIDAGGLEAVTIAWKSLVARFVGAPWELEVDQTVDPLDTTPLEALGPDDFAALRAERDKVWVIRIEPSTSGFHLAGREYDATANRLGPTHRRAAPYVDDLPRALLRFALGLFCPVAEIVEQSGGGAVLKVRGASLDAASPVGRVVAPGTVFQPLRVLPQPDGSSRILNIPFSYLRVEASDGSSTRCAIVSALRDPLTRRVAGKSSLIALGLKAGDRPTRLRFVTRADRAPAAGYVLTARGVPDGSPREVGTTDREGRISLEPGFADGLVILRLIAGSVEPMVELPTMPGELDTERTIPFDPRPATVALETQLDSLRDAVLDLVALRARLEARLKARAEGEDWDGLEATLNEIQALPRRDTYANRLARLKDDAASQQAQTKTAILTKTAQAQVAEVQALIDRYLDDEIVRGYAEALQAHKEELRKAQAKGAAPRGREKPAR